MNVQDNSKFEQMVRNRPSATLPVNKRLVAQYYGRSAFAGVSFALISGIFIYKLILNANSGPFLKNRKSFSFESDPYSGKVRCNYNEAPNY